MPSDHISIDDIARLEGASYDSIRIKIKRANVFLRRDESDARRRVARVDEAIARGILSQAGYQAWLREQVQEGFRCQVSGVREEPPSALLGAVSPSNRGPRNPRSASLRAPRSALLRAVSESRTASESRGAAPETCSFMAAESHGDLPDSGSAQTSAQLRTLPEAAPLASGLALSNPLPAFLTHHRKAERSPQPLLPFARLSPEEKVVISGVPERFVAYVLKWNDILGQCSNGNWRRFKGTIMNGSTVVNRDDLIRVVTEQHGTSKTEFYRKQRLWEEVRQDAAIPQELKRNAFAKRIIPKPRPGRASASYFNAKDNAWQFGKLCEFYLNQAKLSVRAARKMLLEEIDARQRAWGIGHLYDRPTESQCRTALGNFISTAEMTLAREGAKAYNDKCAPYLSRDYSTLRSNDLWVTDQRQVDVRMRDGSERLGRIWMVSFMDVASARIVGVSFGPNLSSDLVMLAATMGLEQAGVPGAIQMDLGKEFNCTAFNGTYRKLSGEALYRDAVGLWKRLDVQVVKAIGRNPQTKTIERWHRIIGDQFDRRFPGWCGSDTSERPEKLQAEEAQHAAFLKGESRQTPLVNIWEYIQAFFLWVERDWNLGARGKGKIRQGMTPAEAWNVKRPEAGLRTIRKDELEIATAEHRFVKVARGGQVNLTFFGQTVEYVAPELFLHIGEDVEAIVSRRSFRKITVVYPVIGGTEQCVAELKPQLEWLPENRDELRAAMRCKAAVRRAIRMGARASNLSLAAANPVELLAAQAGAPAREALPGQKLFGAPSPGGPNGANEISGAEMMMEKLARPGTGRYGASRSKPRFANDLAAKALEMEEEP